MTLRIAIVGSKELACSMLETCIAQGHEVAAVFCRDSEPGMKVWHNQLGHRSLFGLAADLGIKAYEGFKINSKESHELLQSLNLDVVFSCFWSEIFKENTLSIPKLGVFNIHSAMLPRYRGSRPIPWAIINGEKIIGITIHKMLSGVDNGPIVSQVSVKSSVDDNAQSVYEKLTKAGALMFKEQLPSFANNTFKLSLQQEDNATYFPPGEPFNGNINPYWSIELQDRFKRAFSFHPFRGVKPFYSAQVSDNELATVSFIEAENCLLFDENDDLNPVSDAGPIATGNCFKFLLRQSKGKASYFLTKPFSKKLIKSNAAFSLKKLGFKAVFEIISTNDPSEKSWRFQPHFIENGHLKVPVIEVNSYQEMTASLQLLKDLKRSDEQRTFVMWMCDKGLQDEFSFNFKNKVNIVSNETFISCFNS